MKHVNIFHTKMKQINEWKLVNTLFYTNENGTVS